LKGGVFNFNEIISPTASTRYQELYEQITAFHLVSCLLEEDDLKALEKLHDLEFLDLSDVTVDIHLVNMINLLESMLENTNFLK
jgi:hypothetical protein